MEPAPLPRTLFAAFLVAAVSLAVNLGCAIAIGLQIGDANVLQFTRVCLMWLIVPPIALGLIRLGALRFTAGRWHVAALLLLGLGDGVGAATDWLPVLLGCSLAGHLAYAAALWPTRRRSLAWGPGVGAYMLLGGIAAAILAPGAGLLAGAVVVYALVLGGVGALAAIDTAGFLGGLLMFLSLLLLGLHSFVLDIPDPLRSVTVLSTYLGGQALLARSLQLRLHLGVPARVPGQLP